MTTLPSTDTYRFRAWHTARMAEVNWSDTIHTHSECPHLDRAENIDVIEPGDRTPATIDHWCSWCRDNPLYASDDLVTGGSDQ